jgi:cell shape-determining protein MreC
MIQENVTLILFFILVIISLLIFFYYDKRRQKVITETQFDILYNQIAKEKILKEHFKNKHLQFDQSKDNLNQKLLHLKTDIKTIEHSLQELYELIL